MSRRGGRLRGRARWRMGRPLTVMVLPEDGGPPRVLRLSPVWVEVLGAAALLLVLSVAAMTVTWWYLAGQAARVPVLQRHVQELEQERARLVGLAVRLDSLESRYERIRALFGPTRPGAEGGRGLWLPPARPVGPGSPGPSPGGAATLPTSWPLTRRGFVTRTLLEGDQGGHPGIDIAVPAGSYVRAAGAGTVAAVGEDPIYGRYVLIDHGDGYRSLYGHASQTLVEEGAHVEQNEVIALSGSTGRSTAPHLHFQIVKDGEPVDPLTLVRQP